VTSPLASKLSFIYLAFVVYGSLVPWEFHQVHLDRAWDRFSAIPWLDLGSANRADWIANVLLYIPLAYLIALSRGLTPGGSLPQVLRTTLTTFCYCISLAVLIEFVQIFFPPRTVSLNDLVAEAIGAGLGVVLWLSLGDRPTKFAGRLKLGGRAGLSALVSCYAITYVILSVFPFDFVTSLSELRYKLLSDQAGLWLAPSQHHGLALAPKLMVEVLGALPIGALLWLRRPISTHGPIAETLGFGLLLGTFIEGIQLLTASGITQGSSIVTRATGVLLGTLCARWLSAYDMKLVARWTRNAVKLGSIPYFAGVVYAIGLVGAVFTDWNSALARVNELRFLPFYYFYYTTETRATLSLLYTSCLYAPIGLLTWAWQREQTRPTVLKGSIRAATWAAMLCAVIEFAMLFVATKRPDPTDVLIAALAAGIAYWLVREVFQAVPKKTEVGLNAQESDIRGARRTDGAGTAFDSRLSPALSFEPPSPAPVTRARPASRLLALGLGAVLVICVVQHPFGVPWLAVGMFVYCATQLRYPNSWILLLPAVLPIADLAHWTGRFFLGEFDLLALATLSMALWQTDLRRASSKIDYNARLLLLIVCTSYLISLVRGLLPLQPLDLNSFTNYYSHYNSLRAFKGFLWAICLSPFLLHAWSQGTNVPKLLSIGMLIGLAEASLFVLWERLSFTGLFNFSNQYRVTGPFSDMHTGGAYIEAYLACAMAFCVYPLVAARSLLVKALVGGLLIVATHALLVTYSRGGYLALLVILMLLPAFMIASGSGRSRISWRIAAAALLIGTVIASGLAVIKGPYIQERFGRVAADLEVRRSHWMGAIELMDDGLWTTLFGTGLGSYPRTYFWEGGPIRSATYQYLVEEDNAFLRLGSGDSLYVDQLIHIDPARRYRLSLRLRTSTASASLIASICEKWMLESFDCVWNSISVKAADGIWHRYEIEVDSKSLGGRSWYSQRPIKLSLFIPKGIVDVDDVSLIDSMKGELIRNGDFSATNDHWYFATDNHLPWHIKNIWVNVFFEQGGVGLAALVSVVLLTLRRLLVRAIGKEPFSAALIASFVGMLIIGLFDTVIDSPRMQFLFWMMAIVGIYCVRSSVNSNPQSESP